MYMVDRQVPGFVLNTPERVTESVASLSSYLCRHGSDDLDRAWNVYCWIGLNIAYDTDALLMGTFSDQSVEAVLRRRKGICAGYSRLFERLLEPFHIKAPQISGRAHIGPEAQALSPGRPNLSNHAWNALLLNGQWSLVDATWGAGYLDEAGAFVACFTPYYFRTPPGEFATTHFPDEKRWQLLPAPLTSAEFDALPHLFPPFFAHRLEMIDVKSNILLCGQEFALMIDAPEDTQVSARIYHKGTALSDGYTFTQREGNRVKVRALLPYPDTYTLAIFARKRRHADPNAPIAAQVTLKASTGGGTQRMFPTIYGAFAEHAATLIAPFNRRLCADREQLFVVRAPGAQDVAVINEGKWTHLRQTDFRFEGKALLVPGVAQVGARYERGDQYEFLLEYDVP